MEIAQVRERAARGPVHLGGFFEDDARHASTMKDYVRSSNRACSARGAERKTAAVAP